MTGSTTDVSAQWRPLAALASWFIPGAGHFIAGDARRGKILLVAIGSLWLAGFLVGGISIFDRNERVSNVVGIGQWFMAPSMLADYILETKLKLPGGYVPSPYGPHAYEPSFGHVREQGVLYTALAGWLNLLVMLDVIYASPRRRSATVGGDDRNAKKSSAASMTLAALVLPVAVTLAYRPFLDPLDIHEYWMWLLPPLVLAISCVYKAIKLDDLADLPKQTLALTAQILAFIIMADVALWLVNELA